VSFRLLPHTADLRAALDGGSLDELYSAATALFREIVVGQSSVVSREERFVPCPTSDQAEEFFRFVRELVYLYDAESFVPCGARRVGNGTVVDGERFDQVRHESHHHPKALTRHAFVFEQDVHGCRAELVFDL
jgi:SHS2 domain-containing protein